jgi:adenine-specific DNA-methyltransferase
MTKKTMPAATPTAIEQNLYTDAYRLNNPPIGLVNDDTDAAPVRKTYAYDPHIDPTMQWAAT